MLALNYIPKLSLLVKLSLRLMFHNKDVYLSYIVAHLNRINSLLLEEPSGQNDRSVSSLTFNDLIYFLFF